MQKGISPIIAMLMIILMVVVLAMTMYTYSDKIIGRTIQKSVEFLDAACSIGRGEYYLTLRNTAIFDNLPTSEILVNLDGVPTTGRITWDVPVIQKEGGIGVGVITGATEGSHRVKIVSPIAQPQELVLAC